jgi:hypothetical protein
MTPEIPIAQLVQIRTNYVTRPIWRSYRRFQGKQ